MEEKLWNLFTIVKTYKSLPEPHYQQVGRYLFDHVQKLIFEFDDYKGAEEEKWKTHFESLNKK